jgi:hypothetical protein
MPFLASTRGSFGPQGRFGKGKSLLGLSSATPALSAAQILAEDPAATDGTYWLQPAGCPAPFQVHCYMTIQGGGWQLALRFGTDQRNSDFGAGFWMVSDWAGWGYTTKSQIDALGSPASNAATTGDNNAMSPTFAYSSFRDVMVISARSGQESKRLGWRHNDAISNMYSVTGGTSSRTLGNSVLFGTPANWLQSLDIRSDTNLGGTIADQYGFKIRADGGASNSTSWYTGGFWTGTMHYGAQIGCGRDGTGDAGGTAQFGGGFGGSYADGRRHQMHGHWWNHGDGRSNSAWNSGDRSSAFFGHAVYIRA